ncbi:MAG: hypothetical protein AAB526_03010 [Patescibacteria group bacterium]
MTIQKQKNLMAGIVIIFGILIIFLGITQIKNKIHRPFDYLDKNDLERSAFLQQDIDGFGGDKNKDTDNDGLSDYDELNVYSSSPYLKDSDSDGIDDKAEIEKGLNPNCAKGKVCDQTGIPLTPKINEEENKNIVESNFLTPSMVNSTLSVDEMKQILLKSGVTQEQLNQIDDESLRKIYTETVNSTGINPAELNSNSEVPIDATGMNSNLDAADTPTDLQGMSVEQMRKFLLQSGMSEAELSQINDETLKVLFQKAMKEAINE